MPKTIKKGVEEKVLSKKNPIIKKSTGKETRLKVIDAASL